MARPAATAPPAAGAPRPPGDALARAAAALQAMSGELEVWLAGELARLAAAGGAWSASRDDASTQALKGCAHDLKGLGATYGYPLVGRVAASLQRLLDAPRPPAPLVRAHVDAVGAIVREGARGADHPVGARLAQALETAARLRCGG